MTAVDERIAARRAEVRDDLRRRRLRRTLLVLLLLVALAGAWAVERSWLVELAEVQVTGTRRLRPATVIEAAGLELGTSTLRLPLGDATDAVVALPLVAEATIRRVSPVRVRIEVVERVPVLVVRTPTEVGLLDDEGVLIANGAERDLPTLDLLDGSGLPVLGAPASQEAALQAGHQVFVGLSGPLRAEVARVEVRAADDVDLVLASGLRVRMGRAADLDAKVRTLGALLQEVGGEAVAVIDVRVPTNPVVSSLQRR